MVLRMSNSSRLVPVLSDQSLRKLRYGCETVMDNCDQQWDNYGSIASDNNEDARGELCQGHPSPQEIHVSINYPPPLGRGLDRS